MHNFNANAPFDAASLRTGLTNIETYVDYLMYNLWIPCTSFDRGALTLTEINDSPVVLFPDAASNTVFYSMRQPKHWRSGNVSGRVYYTGDLVAGTNISLGMVIGLTQEGAVIDTATNDPILTPTPTANNVLMISKACEIKVGTDSNLETVAKNDLVSVKVRRVGAGAGDNYTSDFCFIGVELFYRENVRDVGVKNADTRWTKRRV